MSEIIPDRYGWLTMPLRCARRLALGLFAALCLASPAAAQHLSAEAQWVEQHPRIRVGIMEDWPPFSEIGADGQMRGISAEIITAAANQEGLTVEFVPGTWAALFPQLIDKRIDALMDVTPKPERKALMNFTGAYLSIPHVIVGEKGAGPYRTEDDLGGRIVALEAGFGNVAWFRENRPEVRIREYPSTSECLDAVARGEADAYVGNRAVATYLITQEVLHNLEIQGRLGRPPTLLAIGVRSDQPMLRDILQDGLAHIEGPIKQNILARWIAGSMPLDQRRVALTVEEQAWVRAHPTISAGVQSAWAPFAFVENGQAQGFAVDVLQLAAQKVGLHVAYDGGGTWSEETARLRTGRIDVLPAMMWSEKRAQIFDLAASYASTASVMVVREGSPKISSPAQLHGKRVLVIEGPGGIATMKARFPMVDWQRTPTPLKGLRDVSLGSADAYLDSLSVVSYALETNIVPNVVLALDPGVRTTRETGIHFGIARSQPPLRAILDKGLRAISPDEMRALHSRWLQTERGSARALPPDLRFTDEERAYIAAHPTLSLGIDVSWPPLEYVDEHGRYAGIASDVMRRVGTLSGFKIVPRTDLSWSETVEAVRKGTVDALPMLQDTPERRRDLDFTRPYLSYPIAIITRDDAPLITGIEGLGQMRTGVVAGYSIETFLKNDHPEIVRVPQRDVETMLRNLSTGKIDAALSNLATATHVIGKLDLGNLKVAAPTPYTNDLSIGVRKGDPVLLSILQKSLDAISDDEFAQIKNRWVALRVELGVNLRTVLLYAVPVFAGLVVVIGVIVVWNRRLEREVAERKRAEAQLARERESLQVIFDRAPIGVAFASEDSTLHFVNPRFVEMFGTRVGELTLSMYVNPEIRGEVLDALRSDAKIENREIQMYNPAHEVRDILVSYLRIEFAGREGILGWLHDITERKRTEREVQESEERLRFSLAAMGAYYWRYDLDTGVLSHDSPGLWLRHGYDESDVPVSLAAFMEFVHPEDASRVTGLLQDHLDGRTSLYETEYRLRTRAGEWRWYLNVGRVIEFNAENHPLRVAGLTLDITERKALEVEITEARDAAESATQAKSAFLAAMSHEIRTPMNGLVGMIDLLRETELTADQTQMMATVRDSAFSLLQIINDILDFSKIEAGKMSLETIPVSVRDIAEGVAEAIGHLALTKRVRFVAFIDPDIPPRLLADQVRLRQILFNLLGNAVKFTETTESRSGLVRLNVTLAEPVRDGRAQLRFEIGDNGIGMSAETVAGLFQPFTQGETSTTRRFGGTGLGLSICKSLVDLMGGKIAVASTLGAGSTFRVELGLAVDASDSAPLDEPPLDGLRILCVSDDPLFYDKAAIYIGKRGGACTRVADLFDVSERIDAARADGAPYHLVVFGGDLERGLVDAVMTVLRSQAAELRFVVVSSARRERKGVIGEDTVVVNASPLRRSAFLHALGIAAGRASPDVEEVQARLGGGPAPDPAEAAAQGRLILVAEDNATNRDVIKRQLNLLGYACEVFPDGAAALAAWKTGRYGLVLTDCHMPNLDGYEMTAAIRHAEGDADLAHTPIVAVTANALQGEAERCLAVGMDDYLAKPLEMARLKRILTKWLPATEWTEADDDSAGDAEPFASGVIDPTYLRTTFGDEGAVRDILKGFVGPARQIADEIGAAFNAGDADALWRAAHKLKSSSRSVGAHALADVCYALEAAGKAGNVEAMRSGYAALAPQLDAAFSEIGRL